VLKEPIGGTAPGGVGSGAGRSALPRVHYCAVQPPSTEIAVPVIWSAAAEHVTRRQLSQLVRP